MRSKASFFWGVALSIGLLAIAAVVEEVVRQPFGGPMKIQGLPVRNATVTGEWHPDFLWMGKAWVIEVRSAEGLELTLDGCVYLIPKGTHTVYSNHDHTNTGEFGTREFWGYPKKIEVGPPQKQTLTQ